MGDRGLNTIYFPGLSARNWIDSAIVETQTDTLVWDADVASGSLTCFTTMLVPACYVFIVDLHGVYKTLYSFFGELFSSQLPMFLSYL